MCTVGNLQRLRFDNSQSPENFIGKPKTVSYLTSSQDSLKHKSPLTFTLHTIYKVNVTARYLPRQQKSPYWTIIPVAMKPLPFSLPKPSFYGSIHNYVTDSSISINTYIQLGFLSSDFLVKFTKSLKIFATSDMENDKEISSGNSTDFDCLTKRYAHSSGGQKSQATPNDTCKDDLAQLIVANISPLRPFPEASKHL